MRLVVSGATEHVRTFEGFVPPVGCAEILFDDGEWKCSASKFVNTFLNSQINCLVTIRECPPHTNMAGIFANCSCLTVPPVIENTQWVKGMAALYKGCSSLTRVSVHKTQRVVDMRQMFMGCTSLTGEGVRVECPSVRGPDGMSNFATGCNFTRDHYSRLLEQLHFQMRAGILPTPMNNVNFGSSRYHPWLAEKRQQLIDYGWQIIDGGTDAVEPLGEWPERWAQGLDSRIENGTLSELCFPSRVTTAKNGVLISPEWILFCQHWPPAPGEWFTLESGERVRVVQVVNHTSSDLTLGKLAEPADTTPARVMTADGARHVPYMLDAQMLGHVARIGVVVVNRHGQPRVYDYQGVSLAGGMNVTKSLDALRRPLSLHLSSGDSGSGGWLIDDGEPTLCYIAGSSSGSGASTFHPVNWEWIESHVDHVREWSPA